MKHQFLDLLSAATFGRRFGVADTPIRLSVDFEGSRRRVKPEESSRLCLASVVGRIARTYYFLVCIMIWPGSGCCCFCFSMLLLLGGDAGNKRIDSSFVFCCCFLLLLLKLWEDIIVDRCWQPLLLYMALAMSS
jgi:hypothetical protein